MAEALDRYGAMLSDHFAYRNEERYAFYVHPIKQMFGKQGCKDAFNNCSVHKGFDSEFGPQKRIGSHKKRSDLVRYQYWFGFKLKKNNLGYSLVVVRPSPRLRMY